MEYEFVEATPDEFNKIQNLLFSGISLEAKSKRQLPQITNFTFYVKHKNKAVGGVQCYIVYGNLYIDMLWVHKNHRNKGIAKKLINMAWDHGRKNNCSFTTIMTMDFEARPLYEQLGYEIEFERSGYWNNSTMYFMKKDL